MGVTPKSIKYTIDEVFFASIYDDLSKVAFYYARKHQKWFNRYPYLDNEDIVQIAVCSILSMEAGLPMYIYFGRLRTRIIDVYRYHTAAKRNENEWRKLVNNINEDYYHIIKEK